MKKILFAIILLFALISFNSCTDLTGEDDFETQQVDPGTVKPPTGG